MHIFSHGINKLSRSGLGGYVRAPLFKSLLLKILTTSLSTDLIIWKYEDKTIITPPPLPQHQGRMTFTREEDEIT